MSQRLKIAFQELGVSYEEYLKTVDDKYLARWERNLAKVSFNHEQVRFLNENFTHIHILVFACDFCPDCQTALPIINKMAEMSDFIDWKIVDRDADKELFKNFHVNNKGLIPIVLFLNQDFYVVERWAERSTLGYQFVYESKKAAMGKSRDDYIAIKRDLFKANSPRLFQANIDEIFLSLRRAVYIVNAGQIEIKV